MKGRIFLLIPFLFFSFLNAWAETEAKSGVPDVINNYLFKETSQTIKLEKDKPLIQDKNIVFSLEFKF